MSVNRRKVYLRVLETWLHTIVAILVMVLTMAVVVALAVRFGGATVVIGILTSVGGLTIAVFALSELIIQHLAQAERASEQDFPEFIRAVQELCRGKWMLLPRLYVLHLGGKPNACAFGWGILGQYGMGITPELYKLLTPQELKAVAAHELGHIRSKDVGVMTILVLITGGAESLAKLFLQGKTSLGAGPFAYLIGGFVWVVAKLIFPVGRNAIAQERESSADALGALYVGSPEPLCSALEKLQRASEQERGGPAGETFLDDLFINHPRTGKRIADLRGLASP